MKIRGRLPVMNVILSKVFLDGVFLDMVTYTCPNCLHRQTHRWFGREDHLCIECGEPTNIKGETHSSRVPQTA